MNGGEERDGEQLWKAFFVVIALLSSVAISLASWVATEVIDLGRDIAGINSSRCTAQDCSSIRESISDIRSRVEGFPQDIPPKWFLDKVNASDLHHSAKGNELERRIEVLERAWYGKQINAIEK